MTTQQLEVIRRTGSIDSLINGFTVIKQMIEEGSNTLIMSEILNRNIDELKSINEEIYDIIIK